MQLFCHKMLVEDNCNVAEKVTMYKCPAMVCSATFHDTPDQAKKDMIKHVQRVHGPILDSSQLIMKVDALFSSLNTSCSS